VARAGLVLGAGGVLGGAWLVGALHAIALETRWDPGSADRIVGTSAGSVAGALLGCGAPPWLMVAHSAGDAPDCLTDAHGNPVPADGHWTATHYRLHRGRPTLGPGSWRLALGTLAQRDRYPPVAKMAGWLPEGMVSTEPLRDTIRRHCPGGWGGWAPHPGVETVATDYATGRRVVFGRPGSPRAGLADAVAASCAIPGFYRSVEIAGRRYVDGGLCSGSNLDLLAGEGLDLVVCVNPTSSPEDPPARTLGERMVLPLRQAAGRRLREEAEVVRETGSTVVLIEPTARDLELMGSNMMVRRRRHDVVESAIASVIAQLRRPEVAASMSALPAGAPALVCRPEGPPETWPDLQAEALGRWATDLPRAA
jgi:NTE family protein